MLIEDFVEMLNDCFKLLKQHPFKLIFGTIAIYLYIIVLAILIP